MSVLKTYFDHSVDQSSPVQEDVLLTVTLDAEGNQITTAQEIDYPTLQASLGSSADWSLNALLKAGINPAFPISTGNNTRLDGLGVLNDATATADALLAELQEK